MESMKADPVQQRELWFFSNLQKNKKKCAWNYILILIIIKNGNPLYVQEVARSQRFYFIHPTIFLSLFNLTQNNLKIFTLGLPATFEKYPENVFIVESWMKWRKKMLTPFKLLFKKKKKTIVKLSLFFYFLFCFKE